MSNQHPKSSGKIGKLLPGHPVGIPDDPTVIARIARPFGRHGELKVIEESALPGRIGKAEELTVLKEGQCRHFEVERVILNGEFYRVKLRGIDDPETGALLSGGEVITPTSERPRLPASEYYIDELIGSLVVTTEGEELGLMTSVIEQGHHDLWVVDGVNGEILIPAVNEFIAQVDKVAHKIVVNPVRGLWD